MAPDAHDSDSGLTPPSPEEVGSAYDRFGPLYDLTQGTSAIHVGRWSADGTGLPATTLGELADRAMDRQTDYYIAALAPGSTDHVLDVGSGTGGPAVRLAERTGARVTGITVSETQVARSRERAAAASLTDRVSFTLADALELPYEDESFDAAWAIDSFAHIADRLRGLRQVWRVLPRGGRFLMTEFTRRGDPPRAQLETFREVWTSPPPLPLAEGLRLAYEAGFELVRLENQTHDVIMNGEVMTVLYRDHHDEILERYGPETTAAMDASIPLFRAFVRDHLGYFVYLLRKP
ncbi:methyltransferase domain-containing protein [Streptomyces sp. WMMC500]|uniref:SAM-dependent methyltransferase n=1 Tax=Streptomyces sp. WMMC500 TaxID=3015154 RepID=UPI00248CFB30|nr:methyltransferase domain-containing protein [Streptomyces sp. WMMC500]WBB62639.1 methyltransferase domain-containing protein [Streptomyces sp. WMMC500]